MKTCMIALLLWGAMLFSAAQTIKQAEYFLDKDKGFGKNTKVNVTLAADGSVTFPINLSNVTPGFHRLYIRTKTDNNKWSLTVRKTIEVLPSSSYPDVAKGEYFFDTDPGTGKAKPVVTATGDTDITQTFTADAAGLSPGYHRLYIRAKDSDGHWSLSIRRTVEVFKSPDTAKIIAAEYFFSKDPGFGKAVRKAFASPSANGTFKFNIPYNSISKGADSLFVRVVNEDGSWSLTKLAKFSGAPSLMAGTDSSLLVANKDKPDIFRFMIAVSPNPVKGNMITLHIQHREQARLQLAVFSINGKMALSQQFDASGSISKQIPVGTLSTGSYVLYVSDGKEVQSVMFVKE